MLDIAKIYTTLLPDLEKADRVRQSGLNRTVPYKRFFFLCLTLFVALIVYISFYGGSDGLSFITLLILIVGLMTYAIKRSLEANKFKEYFQKEIAPGLINNLGPGFSYDPAGRFSKEILAGSKLFSYYNRYNSEDLVKGIIDGKAVTFAEILLEKVSESSSRSRRSTIFRGVFLSIELGSTFPSPFWIVPKTNKLNVYYPRLKDVEGEIVEIDHPEFQNTFLIYSTNTQLTQALLKKNFMDSFIALNDNLKNKKIIAMDMQFAFVNNTILVAMPAKLKFMESRLSEPVNTKDFIEKQLLFLDGVYRVGKIIG